LTTYSAFGQGFRTEFGKNRIQTKEYEWKFFGNETHDVYYYLTGRELAAFVAQEAENHIKEIESFFDFRLEDKITFVLYNSKLDYNQSNMFLERDAYNVGGTTRIIGSTCFIYYPGNHYDFVKNIRQGIGYVVINEMLYGGNIQERLQNSALLNLPDWYVNGLVDHIALGWDHELDSRLRNGILSGKLKNMGSLTNDNKDLVSHAMWMYIDKRYGREALSNILYVSRVNKSIESGYLYVLGKTLAEIYDEWYDYTYYYYLDQLTNGKGFDHKIKMPKRLSRKRVLTEFAVNQDASLMAVANNKMGKIRIHLVNLKTGETDRIFSTGYKSAVKEQDLSYPVFCWDTKVNMLHFIYEKDGNPYYIQYDVALEKETRREPLTQIQKVYSMSMSPDGRSIAISGLRNGRTDIMVLDKTTVFVRSITNDDYDDLNPVFVKDGKGIVFASNRPDEKFKGIKKFENNFDYAGSFDLFYYDYKGKATKFVKLTHTEKLNEIQPGLLNDTLITFLHDANGNENLGLLTTQKLFKGIRAIRRKKNNLISQDDTLFFESSTAYTLYLQNQNDSTLANISKIDTQSVYKDTSYSYSLTFFGENIIKYNLQNNGVYYHLGLQENRFGIFTDTLNMQALLAEPLRGRDGFVFMKPLVDKANEEKAKNELSKPEEDLPEDSFRYYFQTGFEGLETGPYKRDDLFKGSEKNLDDLITSGRNEKDARSSASYYFLTFSPDEIITQFDIGYFNTPYLPFSQGDNTINAPGLRGLSRIAISDMFKDYRLEAGARPSINLSGVDFFGRYENVKNRVDKEVFFYRTVNRQFTDTANLKSVVQELRVTYSYPFSEIARISLQGFVRDDNQVELATERTTLESKPNQQYWFGGKLEFVYDNTIEDGINVRYGTRFKLYYEHFNQFSGFKALNIVGGDFRHYQKIFRTLVWANRVSFASSLGNYKVVYFLGGTENWLAPRFNNEINVDEEIDYIYKSAAVNLRGFRQNIRNGASYGLINSELRLPIFRFFSNQPLKSSFLENFQVIGFADAGVAFNGYSPFSEENAFNKKIFYADPVKIERWSLRKPVVGGYGFGVRSNLMGYFVRLDWAWGVESGIEPNRMFYLSLGTDF
jgi:hypothetical protein